MTRFVAGVLALLTVLVLPARAFDIQTVTSPKGLSAWLVEARHAPIVSLKFSLPGGASLDEVGKEGATVMMADMLLEGAGDLESQAFKLAATRLSSGLSIDASGDYLKGTVTCLKENCAKTLALLKLALTKPRFDERDFARVMQQRLQNLQQSEADQNSIGYDRWSELAYPGHHYGRPNSGRAKDLARLTIADLRAAFARQISKRGLTIAAVGDMDAAGLAAALDATFADLPDIENGPLPKHVTAVAGPVRETVEFEGPQSVVYFGAPGILEESPDRTAAFVTGVVLGGGATFARLNQALREKSGLTYGVSFGHSVSKYAAQMIGSFSTAKTTLNKALEILDAEFANLAKNGPTADELRKVKSYIHGSYVLNLTSNDSIADVLLAARRDGRGVDFAEVRRARIDAVTVEDVKRVAAQLLAPEKRITVVVGAAQ